MAKRPTDKTPPEARTDSNVTRIPVAGRRRGLEAVPDTPPPAERPSDDDLTADALRHALDRGQGGDKIDFMDPAAAPLGTDDEAGGNPPTREQMLEAARRELGPARSPHERRVRRTIPLRAKDGVGLGLVLVAVLLVVVLLALWLGQ